MIHGILAICPECRKVLKFNAHSDGYFCQGGLICEEDGYRFKEILLTELLVDQLLKGEIPHAS